MVDSAAMLTGAEVAILNQARQQPEGARKRVRVLMRCIGASVYLIGWCVCV